MAAPSDTGRLSRSSSTNSISGLDAADMKTYQPSADFSVTQDGNLVFPEYELDADTKLPRLEIGRVVKYIKDIPSLTIGQKRRHDEVTGASESLPGIRIEELTDHNTPKPPQTTVQPENVGGGTPVSPLTTMLETLSVDDNAPKAAEKDAEKEPPAPQNVPLAPENSSSHVPPGYPDPSTVIEEQDRLTSLRNSGILMELKNVRADVVLKSGTFQVRTPVTTNTISPYEQLLFAVASKHYSTAPDVQFDLKTFQFLHCLMLSESVPAVSPPVSYSAFNDNLLAVSTISLRIIVGKLARLLMPQAAAKHADLNVFMDAQACRTSLGELTMDYPSIKGAFKMVYQLVNGGLPCIDPPPQLLIDDVLLGLYIDKIASGNEKITASAIKLAARSTSLPYVSPNSGPQTQIPNAMPPNPSAGATGTGSEQQPFILSQGFPASNVRTKHGDPKSLFRQSEPEAPASLRDTTNFRDSVFTDAGIRVMFNELRADNAAMKLTMEGLREQMAILAATQASIQQSMSVLVSQTDARDLRKSEDINRTLFLGGQSSIAANVPESPQLVDHDAGSLMGLISRIEGIERGIPDRAILEDVKSYLRSHGDVTTAAALTDVAFSTSSRRNRWISRLRTLASR